MQEAIRSPWKIGFGDLVDVYQTQGCTRYWKRGQDDCCWLLNPTCTPTMWCSGDTEWPHPKFDGRIERVASRALELGNELERPLTRLKSSERVRKGQKRYLLESMRWLPDGTDSFSSHKESLRHTTNVQSATYYDGECLHKNARRLLGDVRSKSEVNAQKYKFKCVWKVGISTLYECQTHSR